MRENSRLELDSASNVGNSCMKGEKGQYLSSPVIPRSQSISYDVS